MKSEPPNPGDPTPTDKTHRLDGGDAEEPFLAPPALVGRYRIEHELGRGGMGIVYRAFDPDLSRYVALKLINVGTERNRRGIRRRERLLREAQSLARLSHPNVVPVFDVGEFESSVFLTMELVEGVTLRRWLAQAPRTFREVLALYLGAGEGLAAAHAAGIVHRDFKPDNVIVGQDGRVRVLDFGLARAAAGVDLGASTDSIDGTSSAPSMMPSSVSSSSAGDGVMAMSASSSRLPPALDAALTEDGALIGTPTYMSPEQLLGYRVDARSDQYSFCVALYEALYGRRPFEGRSAHERRRAVLAGDPVPSPGITRVPQRLFRAIAHGLAAVPTDRYDSMEALLAALRRDPVRVATRWAPLALGAFAMAGAVGMRAAHHAPAPCQGAEAKSGAVWNDGVRARIDAAFAATHAPFAPDARRVVMRAVDDYVGRWTHMHRDACEATRVRGEQSEQMLDLRMVCLERRLTGLRAELDVLASADVTIVEHAVTAVGALPNLDTCADGVALQSATALPTEPAARARLEALGSLAARADTLVVAGRPHDAVPLAEQVLKGARTEHWKSLEAEAHFILGAASKELGTYDRAAEELQEASLMGLASRRDDVLARSLTALLWVRGEGQTRFDEAARVGREAEAAVERAQRSELEADLASTFSTNAFRAGKLEEAKSHAARTLALREKIYSPTHPTVGEALVSLANATASLGDLDGADALYARARGIFLEAYGGSHPRMASLLNNVANVNHLRGRNPEAIEGFRAALDIWSRTFGPDHPMVATAHLNLAASLDDSNRDEAMAHLFAARDIYVRKLGADHPDVAIVESDLGSHFASAGNNKEALVHFHKAMPVLEKAHDPAASNAMMGAGLVHFYAHQQTEAAPLFHRAAIYREEIYGDTHPLFAESLFMYGQALTWGGRPAEALPALERAYAILEQGSPPPYLRAQAPMYLAQALGESGRDPKRARELAARALQYAKDAAPNSAGIVAYAEAFLADGTVRKRFPD